MSNRRKQGQRWIFWLLMGIGILFMINLSRGVVELLQAKNRVLKTEQKVADLEAQRTKMEVAVRYQLSPDYAEREIRDKLNMAKPKDVVVILPADVTPITTEGAILSGSNNNLTLSETIQPNWQKWLGLFF